MRQVCVAAEGRDEDEPVDVPVRVGDQPVPERHHLVHQGEVDVGAASEQQRQQNLALEHRGRVQDRKVGSELVLDLLICRIREVPPGLAREADEVVSEVRAERRLRNPRLAEEQHVQHLPEGAPIEDDGEALGALPLQKPDDHLCEGLLEVLVEAQFFRHHLIDGRDEDCAGRERDVVLEVHVPPQRPHPLSHPPVEILLRRPFDDAPHDLREVLDPIAYPVPRQPVIRRLRQPPISLHILIHGVHAVSSLDSHSHHHHHSQQPQTITSDCTRDEEPATSTRNPAQLLPTNEQLPDSEMPT
mmetsp:Transcript_69010/g.164600  ORF Transcript_69010/g.164600 Transcript_69010/m.164600 type:complete len:301 (-) Transcript_69010:18-920(-)